jgi:hypothetical protein
VLVANLFALMGLRQLYFLLGGLLTKLVYLSLGLAVLLAFIGVKLLLHALHENELPFINGGEHVAVPEIPIWMSLGAIVVILGHHDRGQPVEDPQGRARAHRRRSHWQLGTGCLSGVRLLARAEPEHQRRGRDHQGHPHELRRREHLAEDEQPRQRGEGRFEAEQDAEDLRAQPPQRQQLE